MSSEADLDADVKALSILSEHPDLYEEFSHLGCVSSLVSLLSHENTDIAIDAIEIISELTDEDVETEQAQWDVLVDAMVCSKLSTSLYAGFDSAQLEADLLDLLYQNISRFDESIESDRNGVYHVLGKYFNSGLSAMKYLILSRSIGKSLFKVVYFRTDWKQQINDSMAHLTRPKTRVYC